MLRAPRPGPHAGRGRVSDCSPRLGRRLGALNRGLWDPTPPTPTARRALPTWLILLLLVCLAGLITIPIVYFMFLRKGKDEYDEDDIGGSSDSRES